MADVAVKGILGIQILGLLFSLVMLYFTFLHYKRKEYSVETFLFWIVLWIGFIFMVIFPTSLDFVIKDILKFGRRLDFFIIGGFIFLIALVYYNYITVKSIRIKVEKVIRKIALENAVKKNRNEKK
ncbi:DUF2304 domain-containing protein [Candidatus Woesearchaeota archaeon]|nr:DUF2304 domain-containing protein [Candidatus Woesearchaeota archaeon]